MNDAENKKLNSYLELNTLFYETIRPAPPDDSYQFYRSYISKANGQVLEPMCGSGRYLIPYLTEKFIIDGFDASSFMLDKLKTKLREQSLNAKVWQAFCEEPLSCNQYKLIFIPSGSFGHIIEIEEVRKTLENFYNALEKNGILVFETETIHALPSNIEAKITQEVIVNNHQHIKLIREVNIDKEIVDCIDLYELYEGENLIKSEKEFFCVRLYNNPDLLVDLIKQAGFKNIKLIKAYNSNQKPSFNDASIIYECIK